jgi:hypothetical protein
MSKPLEGEITQFQQNIAQSVETLSEILNLCDSLLTCLEEEDEENNALPYQLQYLWEQINTEFDTSYNLLININNEWCKKRTYFSDSGKTNQFKQFIASNTPKLNMIIGSIYETQLEPDFEKLLEILISAQDKFQIFKTLNIAKGKIGESLCHAFLPEIIDSCFFLEGQTGLPVETTTEELAYQTAKEFLAKNPSTKYAIASRPFSGGDPYSVDSVLMLISRQDIENWEQLKRSSATYLVFECKTDSSQLSNSQSLSSYVEKQAKYMENNTLGLEDRHQLGKDLLQASSEGRVIYTAWHLDTPSGKIQARRIL